MEPIEIVNEWITLVIIKYIKYNKIKNKSKAKK